MSREAVMSLEGSCHCGAVAFTVDTPPPKQAISCNCSICRRKGSLLFFAPIEAFQLVEGQDSLRSYTFNTDRIVHKFCTICGTEPFAYATGPDGSEIRAINVRCIPAVDLAALEIQPYDGASK
jgi:hypothetical protein